MCTLTEYKTMALVKAWVRACPFRWRGVPQLQIRLLHSRPKDTRGMINHCSKVPGLHLRRPLWEEWPWRNAFTISSFLLLYPSASTALISNINTTHSDYCHSLHRHHFHEQSTLSSTSSSPSSSSWSCSYSSPLISSLNLQLTCSPSLSQFLTSNWVAAF